MKKSAGGIVVLIMIVGGAWWWLASGDDEGMNDAMFMREAVAERGDLVVSIVATGRIDPVEQVEVRSKASGEIVELPIQEGDVVHRGDLIARLDPITAQNSFDQAKADLAVAEATVTQRQRERDRASSLVNQNLSPPDELDQAVLAFEQANAQLVRAKAALSTAREQLDDTEIRAPIEGIVLTRPVETGQVISSGMTTVTGGTLLCTVANLSEVYVVADVDETDIGQVKPGLTAIISPDAFSDLKLEGVVERVAPLAKVEQNVTMFEVTTVVQNEGFRLKAGMNASVEVVISEANDAVIIPVRAVQMRPRPDRPERASADGDTTQSERPSFAQRAEAAQYEQPQNRPNMGEGRRGGRGGMVPMVEVKRNGKTEWQPVRTGLSNFDNVEIVRGLDVGDTVVYSLSSGAMQSRADFRDRMRSRSSVPGMSRSR